MAYSDYGGYAFKNGARVVERSDFTISPDGTGFGTPGSWPGFAMVAAGMPEDEIRKRIEWPHHHVVLGDGPIFIGLHKQSSLFFYRLGERLDDLALLKNSQPNAIKSWESKGKIHKWLNTGYFSRNETPAEFEIDGHKITAYFIDRDNHYQFVRLEQPDGTLWHGWAGYGVGAGLEECDYGYSTEEQNERLLHFFPDSIAVVPSQAAVSAKT